MGTGWRTTASTLAVLACAQPVHAAAAPARDADLSGLWTSTSLTLLERPRGVTALEVSDAQAAVLERSIPEQWRHAEIDKVGGRQSEVDGWDVAPRLARIGGRARTSWIVDPPDGRLPFSAAGTKRVDALSDAFDTDDPEHRPTPERCLLPGWGMAGPPMLNGPYANAYQIVQTPGEIAVVLENNHEVRHLRLGVAPTAPSPATWMGASSARWEGRTLVVETTGFRAEAGVRPPTRLYVSPDARVTERFTQIDRDHLLYAFEVDDPEIYTRRWKAEMVWTRSEGPMLEYACHEGNYSLPNILRGARREEADAATAAARD